MHTRSDVTILLLTLPSLISFKLIYMLLVFVSGALHAHSSMINMEG